MSKLVTSDAMKQCLQFIYTGSLDEQKGDLQVSKMYKKFCFRYRMRRWSWIWKRRE